MMAIEKRSESARRRKCLCEKHEDAPMLTSTRYKAYLTRCGTTAVLPPWYGSSARCSLHVLFSSLLAVVVEYRLICLSTSTVPWATTTRGSPIPVSLVRFSLIPGRPCRLPLRLTLAHEPHYYLICRISSVLYVLRTTKLWLDLRNPRQISHGVRRSLNT